MEQRIYPAAIRNVKIEDAFFGRYLGLIRSSVLPYQWEALNDRIEGAEKSGCIRNFLIAAGREEGEHYGWYFQDSDLYKWLEAAAYTLEAGPDAGLLEKARWAIELLTEAQREDGYLNTYYQVGHPGQEWTCLREYHELYCAGHLIEAACAWEHAMHDGTLLVVATKLADLICTRFGEGGAQYGGYPGHPEIELALVRLSRVTGNDKYAALAHHFVRIRGSEPNYFKEEYRKDPTTRYPWADGPLDGMRYFQADHTIFEQESACGHAVRQLYFLCGAADAAAYFGDAELLSAAKRLFGNITEKQMYVTGAVGSSGYGESFTCDYDLPNDSMYAETCASVALAFFAKRLLAGGPDSRYADVMERALYNTVLAGMSLDGKNFFYVNPLEIDPKTLPYDYYKKHVLPQRPKWYGCACCPPNIARLVSSIANYAWMEADGAAYMNLFLGGVADLARAQLKIRTETGYPYDGTVRIRIEEGSGDLYIRRPDWCGSCRILRNGKEEHCELQNGYFFVPYLAAGDTVDYEMEMKPRRVRVNAQVRADAGRTAIQRGPFVYCLEEADNGEALYDLYLPEGAALREEKEPRLLGGITVIRAEGIRRTSGSALYTYDTALQREKQDLTFVPYYVWNNRGIGEMSVFIKETES